MDAPRWVHTEDKYWSNHPVWQRQAVEDLLTWMARPREEYVPDYDSPIGRFALLNRRDRSEEFRDRFRRRNHSGKRKKLPAGSE